MRHPFRCHSITCCIHHTLSFTEANKNDTWKGKNIKKRDSKTVRRNKSIKTHCFKMIGESNIMELIKDNK